jgi:hypothetical protein
MSFNRNLKVTAAALATGALIATGAASAPAGATGNGNDAPAVAAKKGKKGKVHKAWPHKKNGKKPHSKLARRLAKQIGPVKLKKHHGSAPGISLRQAPASRATGAAPGVVETTDGNGNKLLLVRSFNIPPNDPLYADLTNYSWTYDNALATIGFVADKDRGQARELLDQLSLLQNPNGSFNFAFDVATGAKSEVVRSGAVAWVGLAGTAFADKYGDDSTYDKMIGGTIDYLLGQRNEAGLITGGSGVNWVSTQHNLLAAELLREAEALSKGSHKFGSYTAATLAAARKDLEAAIEKDLYVTDSATVGHFREGQGDNRIPIDVQALGGMYFDSHKDSRGAKVGRYITQLPGFYIAPRTTTAASNKVSGMKPFLDPGSPNLIWSEGTIESQMAMTRLGSPDTFLKSSVESLAETMKPDTVGPIGADRDSDSSWGQYRTWPTSAAASWLLINELEEKVYLFQP